MPNVNVQSTDILLLNKWIKGNRLDSTLAMPADLHTFPPLKQAEIITQAISDHFYPSRVGQPVFLTNPEDKVNADEVAAYLKNRMQELDTMNQASSLAIDDSTLQSTKSSAENINLNLKRINEALQQGENPITCQAASDAHKKTSEYTSAKLEGIIQQIENALDDEFTHGSTSDSESKKTLERSFAKEIATLSPEDKTKFTEMYQDRISAKTHEIDAKKIERWEHHKPKLDELKALDNEIIQLEKKKVEMMDYWRLRPDDKGAESRFKAAALALSEVEDKYQTALDKMSQNDRAEIIYLQKAPPKSMVDQKFASDDSMKNIQTLYKNNEARPKQTPIPEMHAMHAQPTHNQGAMQPQSNSAGVQQKFNALREAATSTSTNSENPPNKSPSFRVP
jgi:hypothetical protein